MKALFIALLSMICLTATAQKDNGFNQNITIAFGPGIQLYHDVLHTELAQGFKTQSFTGKQLIGNLKIGYDFGPVFTEADVYAKFSSMEMYLSTGINLVYKKLEFSPVIGANLNAWYYGARLNVKPVYIQAVKYKDETGHFVYNLVIGLKGSLFE